MLLVISFSGAQSVLIVSPSICLPPLIKLGEYLARQVSWCLWIGFMMDRNFQAEHMKMRNLENDIPLSEGTGFMVSQKPYELHLQSAFERRQVILSSGISAGRS